MKIGVCGLPSTIDSEYPIFDNTAGFQSGVEGAQQVISQCRAEADSLEHLVTIIKLNGKSSGHMAISAALSSRDVHICLVPEFYFELYSPTGLLNYVANLLLHSQKCVIVISEGISNSILDFKPDSNQIYTDIS